MEGEGDARVTPAGDGQARGRRRARAAHLLVLVEIVFEHEGAELVVRDDQPALEQPELDRIEVLEDVRRCAPREDLARRVAVVVVIPATSARALRHAPARAV